MPYWFQYLEDHNAIYFCFNNCESTKEKPFSDFLKELWTAVETKKSDKLIIIDPDPSKIKSEHFLSRKQINDFADESGYSVFEADDSFLKSHMIIVMQPKIMN